MTLELNEKEKVVLKNALEIYLGEMKEEIVKTDSSKWKTLLHEEEEIIKNIVEKLSFSLARVSEKGELTRIEDFISLAREGKDIQLTIALKKQLVSQKVHPGATEEMRDEVDMYLLVGDYSFKIGKDLKQISKVYMYGSTGESMIDSNVNKNIANQRLKTDYKRMLEANIVFEENYF
jgi:hypothetical protein